MSKNTRYLLVLIMAYLVCPPGFSVRGEEQKGWSFGLDSNMHSFFINYGLMRDALSVLSNYPSEFQEERKSLKADVAYIDMHVIPLRKSDKYWTITLGGDQNYITRRLIDGKLTLEFIKLNEIAAYDYGNFESSDFLPALTEQGMRIVETLKNDEKIGNEIKAYEAYRKVIMELIKAEYDYIEQCHQAVDIIEYTQDINQCENIRHVLPVALLEMISFVHNPSYGIKFIERAFSSTMLDNVRNTGKTEILTRYKMLADMISAPLKKLATYKQEMKGDFVEQIVFFMNSVEAKVLTVANEMPEEINRIEREKIELKDDLRSNGCLNGTMMLASIIDPDLLPKKEQPLILAQEPIVNFEFSDLNELQVLEFYQQKPLDSESKKEALNDEQQKIYKQYRNNAIVMYAGNIANIDAQNSVGLRQCEIQAYKILLDMLRAQKAIIESDFHQKEFKVQVATGLATRKDIVGNFGPKHHAMHSLGYQLVMMQGSLGIGLNWRKLMKHRPGFFTKNTIPAGVGNALKVLHKASIIKDGHFVKTIVGLKQSELEAQVDHFANLQRVQDFFQKSSK